MAGNFYEMFAGVANSAISHASSHFDSQFQSHMRNTSFPANGWTQQNNVGGPQTTQNYKMAPPASKKAIKNLAIVQVTADDLIEESNKECLICLCEQKIGSTACKLACGHLYHQDCLTEWLEKSCTCPVCRYELETDDAAYETDRKDRMLKRKMRFRLDELRSKKVSQLREVATSLLVSLVGCIDKGDVIDKLLGSGMIELIEGAPVIMKSTAEFEAMGVGELRSSLLSFGLSDEGAIEKSELRQRLLTSGRIALIDGPVTLEVTSNGDYGCAARSNVTSNISSSISSTEHRGHHFDGVKGVKLSDIATESDNASRRYSISDRISTCAEQERTIQQTLHSQNSATAITQAPPLATPVMQAQTTSTLTNYCEEDIRRMSVSELKALSASLSISLTFCLFKEDILQALLASGKIKRTT